MVVMQDEARNPERPECLDPRILGEYASGQLEEPQLGECEAHLAQCDQCEETVRVMFDSDTSDDPFSALAAEALSGKGDSFADDAPLVDELIRDLADHVPTHDAAASALKNRAAEVNQLLPASGNDDAIGQVAGYEVIRLLGAGSTGIVYEANDRNLNRKVALKILRPSLGDSARDRFMNEARAAAAISHPNVITIYQVGVEGPLAFIAMELTDGQTLESRLNEVAFIPEDGVRKMATQIAQGLAAAHRNGLIHRDIKPANVWLKAENDDAVILDFGLARIADDDPQMTATGMLAGTPNFMSPEQTRGLELDGRSDLFSLGCLMYRASTGKLPFGSTGILATLQSIQNDEPRAPKWLNPHLSDDFSDLVMASLEKQPASRPESADQLVEALQSERSKWPFPVSSYGDQATDSSPRPALSPAAKSGGFTGWGWPLAALLLISLGGFGWRFAPQIIRIATDQGELVIDAKDEAVEVEVLQGGEVVRVIDTKTDQSIDIKAGEYDLRLTDPANGARLSNERVVLTRGKKEIVSIEKNVKPARSGQLDELSPKARASLKELAKKGFVGGGTIGPDGRGVLLGPTPKIAGSKVPSSKLEQPLYAGRTFDQWMQVVKNDRQMKAKFDALAAVAELAQGDDDRKKLVMDQIKPLLRKYGANYIDGSVVFSQGKYVGLVTDNVRNSQLTHLFIELLQRFSKDDVMELVVDEIRHGTTNSRKFLSLLWSPGTVWSEDPPNQMKHLQAIDRHAFEIASSVLDTIDACDDASRSAMVGTISSVGKIATLKLDPDQDPLMQLHGGRSARKPLSEISDGWKDLITNAFESDQPTQGAIVAVSMVRLFPERANLAEDLVELLADETLQPELRAAGLEALAELPPKRIEPVAGTLLALGKQTEPELLDRTKTTSMYRVDNGGGGFSFYDVSIDVRIGLLLTELEEPPEGLVPWLKELSAEFAEMGQGIANPSSNRVKQVLDRAIERITGEPAKPPAFFGEGATDIANSDSRPHPLYEGRTFNQWMQSLKSERQLKAKFNALAAVAELAQGDDDREKLVMDQIKPLLRKHGSREMEGGDPFQNESNGGTLKNTFRNGELTHLFIEILRRFTADDLMELAIDEIKNGTANSREFLTWVWMAHEMRGSDPPGQLEYLRAIDWRSVEIATAVLETAGSCEANSRVAMIDIITALDGVVAMDLGPEVNASTLYFDGTKRSLDEMPEQWKLLLTNAFESNDLTQKGFVAVTMAKAFPSRKELAKDLVDMLIDTNTPTEIRAASLHALEELPLEKIEPVADRLLSFGKQAGPAKEQLITLTKSQYYYVRTGNACGYRGGSANGVDANVRVAFMLSQLDEPSEQLLPWLEELLTKAQADPGRARFGGTDQAVENTKQVLAEAIQRVTGEPLEEAETSPAGGVF